jgi:threonine dehydratase
MPVGTPANKISATEDNGATVVVAGTSLDEAKEVALQIVAEEGATFIAPYDDPAIIAGAGHVRHRADRGRPRARRPGRARRRRRPVLGHLRGRPGHGPEGRAHRRAVRAVPGHGRGRRPTGPTPDPTWGPTIAEGIAVKSPGKLTTEIIAALADDVVAVPERLIEEAIVWFLEIEKMVSEGAGAAPLAALLADPDRFAGRTVGLVLSGANIDLRLLSPR